MRFLAVLPIILAACNAYRVLVLGPLNGKSHFLFVSAFVRALLNRGHDVTYLTSMSLNQLKLANYTEVLIDPPYDVLAKCMYLSNCTMREQHFCSWFYCCCSKFHAVSVSTSDLIKMSSNSALTSIIMMATFPHAMNAYIFENPNVQKFIKSTDLHFDVIVAEEFYSESLYMLAHKHKAPLVTICKFLDSFWITIAWDLNKKNSIFHRSHQVLLESPTTLIANKVYWIRPALYRIM